MSLGSNSEILSLNASLHSNSTELAAIAKVTDAGGYKFDERSQSDFSIYDGNDGIRFEERLQLQHLEEIEYWFQTHQPPRLIRTPTKVQHPDLPPPPHKAQRQAGLLTREEFKDIVVKVLGTHAYDDQLDTLFTKLDVSCDGYVDWNEFCTYMLLQFRENEYMRAKKQTPFQSEPRIKHIVHNRQETTTKLIAIDNPLKYVTISKEGALSVFDNQLHFEKHYVVSDGEDNSASSRGSRKIRYWMTDAVYMANCRKIALATTGRDIRFLDVTSSVFFEEFHLFSLPHVPSCLEYVYNKKSPNDESILIYGDEAGNINLLYFSKPMSQLFETPFKKDDGVQKIYYPELKCHLAYVRHVQLSEIHPETVRQVLYQADNECVISSSGSPKNSLVIIDIDRKKKTYIWKISKGVECFDYKKSLNVLVTGGSDHMIRIWNPYVTSKPVAILQGHHMSVIDIKLHEALAQIFSYSRDATLKVWDIKDQVCLQTITVKFPSSMLGRMPEYGPFPMHLQLHPGRCLLITANDYVAQLKLGTAGPPKSSIPTSHVTQLCCALYNPLFKTVVTGADDSSVAVWDLETGVKSMLFTNAHGNDEITCMTFDSGQRRLFTGARNGAIKVWNIQNGHNLHELETVDESEITGILPIVDKKMILAVGWSRIITVYDDSDPDNHNVKADTSWRGANMHRDDILSIAHLPPYHIATCSFDGEINVWNIETRNIYVKLRKGQQPKMASELYAVILGQYLRPLTPAAHNRNSALPSSKSRSDPLSVRTPAESVRANSSSRPNSRHRKCHKPIQGQAAPVDKLIFLKTRAAISKRNEAAMLISSEAGYLVFWSIHGAVHQQGVFYACEKPDESVLGMTSTPEDKLLITGDTQGGVAVWLIDNYCATYHEQKCTDKPDLLYAWQAHDSAIVSVEYVEHECGQFVITASTDCTARLFTLQGFCVGIFGQKSLWNLRQCATWKEAPPEVEQEENEDVTSERSRSSHISRTESAYESELENSLPPDIAPDNLTNENTTLSIVTIDRGDTLTDMSDNRGSYDNIKDNSDVEEHKSLGYTHKHKKSLTAQPQRATKEVHDNKLMSRSVTFHCGVKLPLQHLPQHKSLLGSTVDKRFSKITEDRKERREFFEKEFGSKPMNRMGNQCCPYQAINIPEIKGIELPSDLPLSPRMINRGLTAENLKLEDLLRTMDSTLGDTDIHANSDYNTSTWKQSNASFQSQTSSERSIVCNKIKSASNPRKLPALGKRTKSLTASSSSVGGRRSSSVMTGPRRLSPIQS